MSYTLFIDDIRSPTSDLHNPMVAVNVTVAKALVEIFGLPDCISFDHDLGNNEPVATDFLWWLVNGHLNEQFDLNNIEEVIIHSANPIGARNLQGLWDCFSKSELISGVLATMRPQ